MRFIVGLLFRLPGMARLLCFLLGVEPVTEAQQDVAVAVAAGRLHRKYGGTPESALFAAEALELAEGRVLLTILERRMQIFAVYETGTDEPAVVVLPRATQAWQQTAAPLN